MTGTNAAQAIITGVTYDTETQPLVAGQPVIGVHRQMEIPPESAMPSEEVFEPFRISPPAPSALTPYSAEQPEMYEMARPAPNSPRQFVYRRIPKVRIQGQLTGRAGVYIPPTVDEIIQTSTLTLDRAIPPEDVPAIQEAFKTVATIQQDVEGIKAHLERNVIGQPDTAANQAMIAATQRQMAQQIEYALGSQLYTDTETLTNNSDRTLTAGDVQVPPRSRAILDGTGASYITIPSATSNNYRWAVTSDEIGNLNAKLQMYNGTTATLNSARAYYTGATGGDFVSWDTGTTSSYTATSWAYSGTIDNSRWVNWYDIGTCATDTATWNIGTYGECEIQTPAVKFRRRIRQQLEGADRKRPFLAAQITPAEQKARDTLRDMISEAEWRRYITNSFIMVKGQSGQHYQVFSDHNRRIKVWEKGKHVANLCIHTHADCPPTDHVISMKVMIELDEDSVWKDSNVYGQNGHTFPRNDRNRTINDLLGDAFFDNGGIDNVAVAMQRHIDQSIMNSLIVGGTVDTSILAC